MPVRRPPLSAILAGVLLASACSGGPRRDNDGNWRLAETDRHPHASVAGILERLTVEAKAFCAGRGATFALEGSTGSSRPLPVQATLYFRCDGPPLAHTIEPPPVAGPTQIAEPDAAPAGDDGTPAAVLALPPPSSPSAQDEAPIVGGHRVVVSFNSLAAGPDPATEARFLALVAEFEREVGHPLPWSRGAWGREGEYDACLSLLYASTAQQADFVRRLRAALEPGGRASIREYSHCGNLPTR